MTRRRTTVASLLIGVAVAACAFASLANPTELWLGLFMYAKVGLLLLAAFRARYGRGHGAAWWFGFAAFGCAHLALCDSDWSLRPAGYFGDPSPGYFLPFDIAGMIGVWVKHTLRPGKSPGALSFTEVASFWMTMAVACFGGLVSRWVASRQP